MSRTLFATAVIAATAHATFSPVHAELLQLQEYGSPSGAYVLRVEPTQRSGAGPGLYTLTKEGEALWERELPLTLWNAVVTDGGRVAGYGYPSGQAAGSLDVLVLDANGDILARDSTERTFTSFLFHPTPLGGRVFAQPDLDRVFVEVLGPSEPPVEARHEGWRTYRLSDGGRDDGWKTVEPALSRDHERLRLWAARPVPTTSLTLFHWCVTDYRKQTKGAVFLLVDRHGRTVWKRERKAAYSELDASPRVQWELEHRLENGAGIVSVGPGLTFTLWAPDEGVVQDFTISTEQVPWAVKEGERRPRGLPEVAEGSPDYPRLQLQRLGTTTLASGDAKGPLATPANPEPIRAFAFIGNGTLGIVREVTERSFRYEERSGSGELLFERTIEGFPRTEATLSWFHGGADQWYVVAAPWPPEPSTGALPRAEVYRLDAVEGDLVLQPVTDLPQVTRLVPNDDGGFTVLGQRRGDSGPVAVLARYDASGSPLWRIDGIGDGALSKPQDLARTVDDTLVVLSYPSDSLQLFSGDGEHLRDFDLTAARGATRVLSDASGSIWITDGVEAWPIDLTREVGASIELAPPPGSYVPSSTLALSPTGALWYTDGAMLGSFAPDGERGPSFGDVPSPDVLTRASMAWVDPRGLIVVEDRRSGSWHVFEPSGEPLYRSLAEGLFAPASFTSRVRSRKTADLGELGPDALRDGPTWIPRGWDELVRIDAQGQELARLARDAEERWWSRIDAFAFSADGTTLSVLDRGGRLSVFDGEGRNGRLHEVRDTNAIQVAASAHHTILADSRARVHLVDHGSGEVRRLKMRKTESPWRWGISPDGTELWGVELDALKLHRFALPVR